VPNERDQQRRPLVMRRVEGPVQRVPQLDDLGIDHRGRQPIYRLPAPGDDRPLQLAS
jgi:hypothetical protein